MGRRNNTITGRKGRPKGAGFKATSRDKVQCIVESCRVISRLDHVREHQQDLVLWTSDAIPVPASSSHPEYCKLSENRKIHTDFFRDNGYNYINFPVNKRIAATGPMDMFLSGASRQKKTRLDKNRNDLEYNSDDDKEYESDRDPDDPDTASSNDERESDDGGGCGDVNLENASQDLLPRVSNTPPPCNTPPPRSPVVLTPPPRSPVQHQYEQEISDDDGGGHTGGVAYSSTAPSCYATSQGAVKLDEETIAAVADEISSRFANKVEVENIGGLARVIARRVIDEQENVKRRQEASQKMQAEWIEDETSLTCAICYRNKQNPNIPKKLLNSRRGLLGVISKGKDNSKNMEHMERHCKRPVHLWCASVDSGRRQAEVEENKKNDLACEMIVTNAIHTLKDPCGSSQEFVRLNNKDDLNSQIQFADKNDGAEMYFTLRSIVFEKLSKKIQEIIQDVETLGACLDKVTIGSTSYTVIVTYFFWKGRIKTVLNALFVMSTDHNDGAGVAEMLCNTLCQTLGLSREDLRFKLEHLSYDGVYEVPEHRIRGGGGLGLINHVAEFLDLGPDIITGKVVWRGRLIFGRSCNYNSYLL